MLALPSKLSCGFMAVLITRCFSLFKRLKHCFVRLVKCTNAHLLLYIHMSYFLKTAGILGDVVGDSFFIQTTQCTGSCVLLNLRLFNALHHAVLDAGGLLVDSISVPTDHCVTCLR